MTVLSVAIVTLSLAVSTCEQTASERARVLVQELGGLPASLPATGRSDGSQDPTEEGRRQLYAELRELEEQALPALSRGLADPNVQVRRNAALFLGLASGSWFTFNPPRQKLDILTTLPALTEALQDGDPRVRGLAAQAIGNIGPRAASAVRLLVPLLSDDNEGARNSACIGLAGIGPAAKDALPALREALSDPSADVRRFAQRAIGMIEGQQ
jgi:HEAT repeat protein